MKIRTITAKLNLPFVESFWDYHDITQKKYELLDIFKGGGLKVKEAAYDGQYWALFYYKGEKPDKKELKELLDKAGFNFDDDSEIY